MKPSVLFLLPYPLRRAPSQRFRVEAFFPELHQAGIGYRTHCFLDEQAWAILYEKGSAFRKVWSVLQGFLSRLFVVLFVAPRYPFIFVHREASPLGPPLFEWILARVYRKKIIYDFDDAIWIPSVTESNKLAASIKCFWKIKWICRWSYKVAAGNDFLAAFASRQNNNVVVLPTCVDTKQRFNQLQVQEAEQLVIGWTGSHSTLPYLDQVAPVLQKLAERYSFSFLVICNQPPAFALPNLRFLPWKEDTEIGDLLNIHIGLMPLVTDAWSEGKCGFKIIQYMALGIPAVASPVGVNQKIIDHGANGFLCSNEKEWIDALETLLTDTKLRQKMGAAGRTKIVDHFSIQAHGATFRNLFV